MDANIEREGKQIIITISDVVDNWSFPFHRTAEHEYVASLLYDRIIERLRKHMVGIRRKYYEKGYKDGRGKKRKEKYFSTCFHESF